MEPRELPGFYYDPEKKKYFHIAKNAPPAAKYSAESVKRRKLEHEKEEKARKATANRKKLIRRAKVLQEPMMGGFLANEYGLRPADLPIDCFTRGLQYKGSAPLQYVTDNTTIEHLCVLHSLETKHGFAIGAYAESEVRRTYLIRDEHDRVTWDTTQPFHMQGPEYLTSVQQISSLQYSQTSHCIYITSREPGSEGGLYLFESTSENKDFTASGHLRHIHTPSTRGVSRGPVANTCAPAPAANSDLLCIMGTSQGLGLVSGDGHMRLVGNLPSSVPPALNIRSSRPEPTLDVLSVDFLPGSPQVVLAGIRGSRRVCIADLREKTKKWEWITHRSSPAHVRGLNEHHVLAAGPNNAMSIYDLRFRYRETWRNKPIVVFPEYRNDAQIHFGLDVDTSLGVVAVSDSPSRIPGRNNTISLFSFATGKRLKVPALEEGSDPGIGSKALQFHTLPQETNASLFVGGTSARVLKYSFGGNVDEWSGEVFGAPPQ